jgi:hypothetical protein
MLKTNNTNKKEKYRLAETDIHLNCFYVLEKEGRSTVQLEALGYFSQKIEPPHREGERGKTGHYECGIVMSARQITEQEEGGESYA